MASDEFVLGESQEAVAYALLRAIARHERKILPGNLLAADREWLLSTYAECLRTVQGKGELPHLSLADPHWPPKD